jgi:hypothetical protein
MNLNGVLQKIHREKIRFPVVIAGHYCISEQLSDLSSEADAEEASFECGVALFKELTRRNNAGRLVLFVNDIGIDPQHRSQLKEGYRVPNNYQIILRRYMVDESDLNVVFESSLRNKATRAVDRMVKRNAALFSVKDSRADGLLRCIDTDACEIASDGTKQAITITGPEGESLVVKEGTNAKCNAIMATLYNTLSKENPESTAFVNLFNRIYVKRIDLGCFVFRKLYQGSVEFINMFFDDREILIPELETVGG